MGEATAILCGHAWCGGLSTGASLSDVLRRGRLRLCLCGRIGPIAQRPLRQTSVCTCLVSIETMACHGRRCKAEVARTWRTGRQCPHRSTGCQIRHGRRSNRACQSSSPDHAGWMIAWLYPALSICSCAARLGTAVHAIMEWPRQSISAGANGTEGGVGSYSRVAHRRGVGQRDGAYRCELHCLL